MRPLSFGSRTPENFGRRVTRSAGIAALATALAGWPFSRWTFAVSLTATAAVAIFHLLWVERLLAVILTGESPRLRRRDGLKILGHFSVLTALAASASLWSSFSPVGAALGVTIVVAAVTWEGLRTVSPDQQSPS